MTGTITLSDGGQNYIEFDVVCSVIQAVRPAKWIGWKGTKLLNAAFLVGGRLLIKLQWKDYEFPLKYPIVEIIYEELAGGEWLRDNMSKERKQYVNPLTFVEHFAYSVDCKGVPFYFDCVNHAAIAAAKALLNIDKIPEVLIEDVTYVQLVDEVDLESPFSIAAMKAGGMTIFDNNIIDYGIVAHEAAHAWAMDKWGDFCPPGDTDYVECIRFSEEKPITLYATTNYAEDLAEGVRYYVFDPARMKKWCPLRYDIIERMMTDPSYYG